MTHTNNLVNVGLQSNADESYPEIAHGRVFTVEIYTYIYIYRNQNSICSAFIGISLVLASIGVFFQCKNSF